MAPPPPDPNGLRLRLYGALALIACIPLGAALIPAASEPERLRHMIGGYALAGLPYLYLLARWRALPSTRRGLWILLASAAVARFALVGVPPVLSEDVWRYVWDGLVQHAGVDPFAHAPVSSALDGVAAGPGAAAVRAQIGHGHIPTIYPPAAQSLFYLTGFFGSSPTPLRLVLAAADVGTCAALWVWARRIDRPPTLAWLYAFAPVALLESSVGSHIDALGVLGMVCAGAWLAGHAPIRAGLGWAVGVGAKLLPLMALPALLRAPRALVVGVAAVAALYAIYWSPDLFGGLQTYSHRWQANGGAFAVLVEGYAQVWPNLGRPVDAPEMIVPWIRRLVGPNESGIADVLWPDEVAFGAAKATALGALGAVWGVAVLRRGDYRTLLTVGVGALLLVSPVVHPWYLMWALPFVAFGVAERRPWAYAFSAWSLLVWIAYIPRPLYLETGIWAEDPAWRAVEYGPLWLGLLLAVLARSILPRPSPSAPPR